MEISKLDMRDAFLNELYAIAKQDRRIILLSGDFGAPSLDKFKNDLCGQYINVGIAEQGMVSIAAGLALSGKVVYMYAISPFLTLRCYEQIKIDLCTMNLSVTAVGVGSGFAYNSAGPTHHATEDIAVMRALPNMAVFCPSDSILAACLAKISYETTGPKYIRLDRGKTPLFYSDRQEDFLQGLAVIRKGRDLYIISTGSMVHRAIEVSDELARHSIDCGVIDLYRLKPVNKPLLLEVIEESKKLVSLEEHLIDGGAGTILAEVLCDAGIHKPLKRIAISGEHCFGYGDRESLQECCGLDIGNIVNTILKWQA
jgi:transketolase